MRLGGGQPLGQRPRNREAFAIDGLGLCPFALGPGHPAEVIEQDREVTLRLGGGQPLGQRPCNREAFAIDGLGLCPFALGLGHPADVIERD